MQTKLKQTRCGNESIVYREYSGALDFTEIKCDQSKITIPRFMALTIVSKTVLFSTIHKSNGKITLYIDF